MLQIEKKRKQATRDGASSSASLTSLEEAALRRDMETTTSEMFNFIEIEHRPRQMGVVHRHREGHLNDKEFEALAFSGRFSLASKIDDFLRHLYEAFVKEAVDRDSGAGRTVGSGVPTPA